MGDDQRHREDREANLVREIDRLRSLLKQAGNDAQKSLRETEATERDTCATSPKSAEEREQPAPISTSCGIGSRIRLPCAGDRERDADVRRGDGGRPRRVQFSS
jgi:hypothetical protein